MKINELVSVAFQGASEKGFYDGDINVPAKLMGIVEEISEASNAHRRGQTLYTKDTRIGYLEVLKGGSYKEGYESDVKGNLEEELADVMINVASLCGALGIDLEQHIRLKLRYNELREGVRHGRLY